MSFRSRSDGSHYPIKGSLYGRKPVSQAYHRNIHFANETEARESVSYANARWENASRSERVHLLQAMNEAANRAKVMSNNPRLSYSEQRKAAQAHAVLRGWVDSHKGKE